MTFTDLLPIPSGESDFWSAITVDNTSTLKLVNLLIFKIEHEDYISLSATHNISVMDITGKVVYQKILNVHLHSFEFEPVRIINGTLLVFDPYTIYYDDGGNRLNRTFSVFNNSSFTFQLDSNRAPRLFNHSVTPDRGDEKTSFVFEVEYRDMDGDEPQYVNLIIENDSYEMDRVEEGKSPEEGLKFTLEFLSLDDGELNYRFTTDDGRGFANSNATLDPPGNLPVKPIDDDSGEEDDGTSFSLFIIICFSMLFIIIVFMAVMGYLTQKKVKEMGGVEPGTLPEDLEEPKPKEKMECSECGAVIDADSDKCSKCGEVFDGEEFQCPKCGKIVPEEAEVCKYCGNKFLSLIEEERERVRKEESERVREGERRKKEEEKKFVDKIYCSECGAVVDESMTECPGCGEKFEEEIEEERERGGEGERKRGREGERSEKTKDTSDADSDMEVDDDAGFICSVCGAMVQESSNKCPKCGTEFE
jgi:RNA polymerase subunit RPABC4/transcription elongation factor Spt4